MTKTISKVSSCRDGCVTLCCMVIGIFLLGSILITGTRQRWLVCPEECGIKPWWPRWVSIDWGFEHPAAVYWHTLSDQGVTITYRELVQNWLSPRMLAEAIVERSLYSDFEGVAEPDASVKGPAREKISRFIYHPTHSPSAPTSQLFLNRLARCLPEVDFLILPRPTMTESADGC